MDYKIKLNQIISKNPPICSYFNCQKDKRFHEKVIHYKSCHYCYTFYCSRECRQSDWKNHKNFKCVNSRSSSLCKQVLIKVGRNLDFRYYFTELVKNSYDNFKEHGLIWLDFKNSKDAENFINKHIDLKEESYFLFSDYILPKYIFFDFKNLDKNQNNYIINQLFSNCYKTSTNHLELETFYELCKTYNPQKEFIILVSIKVSQNKDKCFFEKNRQSNQSIDSTKYILKFIKIPFYNEDIKIFNNNYNNLTMILTSFKTFTGMDNKNDINEKTRQLFLANLLNEFETRNINIRSYPNVYKNLCLYVNQNKSFTPICLFPRDLHNNNLFMCLIMPNSEFS
jgi:hypothetical protein